MENEIVKPVKVYTVKNWEVRLKSGSTATYNIREDLEESYRVDEHTGWCIWSWPKQKRESRILASEIAAVDYAEVEMKEIRMYKPKKGAVRAEGQNETNGNR